MFLLITTLRPPANAGQALRSKPDPLSQRTKRSNTLQGALSAFYDIATTLKQNVPDAVIDFIPFPDELKGKYQTFTQADITALIDSGYNTPFHSLEEGVTKYHDAFLNSGGYLRSDL